MSALTYKKNDDLESGRLDKMTVFQDCISGFNSSPIQAKKCRMLLAKLIHLLSTGESFPPDEATKLFFSISKLFQHKDAALRQTVYLAIKELASTAQDVLMVTASIMKDAGVSNDVIYKPNAIRALVRVVDASVVPGMERLMKTAIVDSHAAVSSAGLVSSYHLLPISKDIVRRWTNEVQEAVTSSKSFPPPSGGSYDARYPYSSKGMTQYHALGLLYHLRSHDRMALIRMIQQLSGSGSPLHNANAIVMLMRYVSKIVDDDQQLRPTLMSYLEGWLRHKSDIVNLEAAKTILSLKSVTDQEANAAVVVLKAFLSSPRPISRFAAIRLLNRFAMVRPQAVVSCNVEIEQLISDPSRSIATYAITTLLKTGNETSVDRLMDQIQGFMGDISDEFKIIVVDAIRSLALKFPVKYSSMLTFLANTLRDDGGLQFKTAVVEALFDMIRFIPESREVALSHLCEFIEDCEYTELTVRILHLLSLEGPKTSNPTMYVRYIYNRVVLENAIIRAAAVMALAHFALADDPQVRKSIQVLLTRCLDDVTDEVRDRAAFSLRLLGLDKGVAEKYLFPNAKYDLPQLEAQLVMYVSSDDKASFEKGFDISSVGQITDEQALTDALKRKTAQRYDDAEQLTSAHARSATPAASTDAAERQLEDSALAKKYAEELLAIEEFKPYGQLLKSSKPIALTESESEYVVSAVKHVFKDNLVVQYNVTNTFAGSVIENVSVEIGADFDLDEVLGVGVGVEKIEADNTGVFYVGFPRNDVTVGTLSNDLKFLFKEIDPSTGEPEEEGYDDEYNMNALEIVPGDYVIPAFVGNFQHAWDELDNEAKVGYQLPFQSIAEAIPAVVAQLSMQPLEGSDSPSSDVTHSLKLFGRLVSGEKVGALVKIIYSAQAGLRLQIAARSENAEFSELLAGSLESLHN